MLGKSPERDREIDNVCQMIRNWKRAGIPMVKYNLTILCVVRSEPTPGRGSATYSTFNYDKAKAMFPPLTEAGPVSADQMWERIDYFLQRVVPVATEERVRMACHPHDPGMPEAEGFRGVHRVLGSVNGLKRFVVPRVSLRFRAGQQALLFKGAQHAAQVPRIEAQVLAEHACSCPIAMRQLVENAHLAERESALQQMLVQNPDLPGIETIEGPNRGDGSIGNGRPRCRRRRHESRVSQLVD